MAPIFHYPGCSVAVIEPFKYLSYKLGNGPLIPEGIVMSYPKRVHNVGLSTLLNV